MASDPLRPGNAIDAFRGDLYSTQPGLARALSVPAVPPQHIQDKPLSSGILWQSTQISSASTQNTIIPARPNRVALVIQNNDITNPLAVNFDNDAAYSGTGPYTVLGLLILPGGVLYVDRWCPTCSIHVYAPNVPCSLTEGLSLMGATITDAIQQSSTF